VRQAAAVRASQLVFVPLIGFRAAGTRVLRERAETSANGTTLTVLAVAAAPERTDVIIEWERSGDPAACPPDSQLLSYANAAPLEKGTTAALTVGTHRSGALTMSRRASHFSHGSIGAIDALSFPPLSRDADGAELRISDAGQEWRVPLIVADAEVSATALAAEVARDGIVVRATAWGRYQGELIVELEVEGSRRVRQVGAPLPTQASFGADSDEVRRTRRAEMRRVLGDRARPITLEDDRGTKYAEVGRMLPFEPRQALTGPTFVTRLTVRFDAPSADVKSATLVVPFVDVSDPEGSVTADLRTTPIDLEIGGNRFRVISAESHAKDHRLLIVEGRPSPWPPRFIHPATMRGADGNGSYPNLGLGEQITYSAAVADPPIVTFSGAVFRVDGPLRLGIPLT